jgi:sugar O-acyltransferase (sialic acid O-acetyltransferase NeuD family)
MLKRIAILGAGGHGRETAQLIKDINKVEPQWELIGYFDDNETIHGQMRNGFPVLGHTDMLASEKYKDIYVICGFSHPQGKKKAVAKVKELQPGIRFATLIHPTAVYGDENTIGEGTMICAGSIVTTNVNIGSHVIINYGCTVGHDCIIEDYAAILPGTNLSGNVTIREGVQTGTGTAVIPGMEIGAYTIVGAGAVVAKPLPAHCTAVGVPARPIKQHV